MGCVLFYNEASTELQYKRHFPEKKRKVAYTTFEKWRHDFDREFEIVSWLECESAVEGGTKVMSAPYAISFGCV